MSKKQSNEAEMVEVIALHDLSYVDHKREPQYRRQSSRPFMLDKSNADQFLASKAIALFKPAAVVEKVVEQKVAEVEEDFGDEDFGDAAAQEAVVNPARGFPGGKNRK